MTTTNSPATDPTLVFIRARIAELEEQNNRADYVRAAALRALLALDAHTPITPALNWIDTVPEGAPVCEGATVCAGSMAAGHAETWPCEHVRLAAALWNEHPDYRPEWEPTLGMVGLPEMTITVRDNAAESANWGTSRGGIITRLVTISAFCPVCGHRRGEPAGFNFSDDGDWSWVQRWTNPCGHVDMYENVILEAAARLKTRGPGQWVERGPIGTELAAHTDGDMSRIIHATQQGHAPRYARVVEQTARRVVLACRVPDHDESLRDNPGLDTYLWEPAR